MYDLQALCDKVIIFFGNCFAHAFSISLLVSLLYMHTEVLKLYAGWI